ncbi:unnamed protein product [Symbiodinium pilosum]|uniref:Apple domain-containing protein n=1 Tax=Symbiodinium pilosum TaxID=2952 RepID=A0A812JXY1_SYMPI|nr:unnamed protein product [Symbiodinium pilosum]
MGELVCSAMAKITCTCQAAVAKCILQGAGLDEASCTQANEELEVLRANCVLVGRDILDPFVESTYTATRCTHCMPASGALLRQVLRTGLLECEELCEQDTGCRGFDYDTIRGLCRTWGMCPNSARSDENGCQWATYDQPRQTVQSTTSQTEANTTTSTAVQAPNKAVALSAAVSPGPDVVVMAACALQAIWIG